MKHFTACLTLLLTLAAFIQPAEARKADSKSTLTLSATVRDNLTKKELVGSKVRISDSAGNLVDSCTASQTGGITVIGDRYEMQKNARFSLKVPRTGGDFTIEAEFDGYSPVSIPIHVKKAGSREFTRSVSDILMSRAPKELDAVTVTASKIKFYNRGDTIVFNADAFELAEGSMLDGLIKQLPGVEIKEGGQIYVNGEFVENLMLNGKDFFKGNNEIMLDNIAAYTVRNVEVYKRQTDEDKFIGSNKPGQLTLDVKLKKEYNQGWIFNLEAGVGTSDRYLGRAFVNRFTDNTRVSLVATVNNLNDNRKPGESSAWTPSTNTVGTVKTQMAALDYNVTRPQANFKANGNFMWRHSTQNDRRDVNRLNFLPGGNTWDYTFGRNTYNNLSLQTYHTLSKEKNRKYRHNATLVAFYSRNKAGSSDNGASLRTEKTDITSAWIDSLYTSSPSQLDQIINRTVTRTLNSGHMESITGNYYGTRFVTGSDDSFTLTASAQWRGDKNEVWRDWNVNYGSDPTPAVRQRQYFDNSPNGGITATASLGYRYAVSKSSAFNLTYAFNYTHEDKDSYMYSLDRLNDMGVFGTLPEGYLTTLNAANSYTSSLNKREHSIELNFNWSSDRWWLNVQPALRFQNNDLRYFRNGRNYDVAQHNVLFSMPSYAFFAEWRPGQALGPRKVKRNKVWFELAASPSTPGIYRMVDFTDDSDPMNIWLGNPDLKPAYNFSGKVRWTFTRPTGSNAFNNVVLLEARFGHNSIVNGYTYDRATGVRTNKAYNVRSGNRTLSASVSPNWQFGSRQQFTLSYSGKADLTRSADMIGTDVEVPGKSTVNTLWNSHTLEFAWQIGKQTLAARGALNQRHTSSDRPGFNDINATDGVYQLRGLFNLPKGLGIKTDITVYARRGYGARELDTTDPVWNLALSWNPSKSRFVFMLDGFDMLRRLSNVNYAVNAQGRTVTFRNVLPRYILFHVQYRLNIQPKKKMITNIETGNFKDLFK